MDKPPATGFAGIIPQQIVKAINPSGLSQLVHGRQLEIQRAVIKPSMAGGSSLLKQPMSGRNKGQAETDLGGFVEDVPKIFDLGRNRAAGGKVAGHHAVALEAGNAAIGKAAGNA